MAARFAEGYGGVAYWQADADTAEHWYGEALDLWQASGDKREIANALYNDAYADILPFMGVMPGTSADQVQHTTRFLDGRAKLERALELYREVGDDSGEANILWALGSYYFFTNDAVGAEPWYQRSLDLHRTSGNRTMEAWSLHMLSLVHVGRGQVDAARRDASEALDRFTEGGDVAGITLILDDLAAVAVADGDLPRAGRLYGAARHLQQTTGTGLATFVEETYAQYNAPSPRKALSAEDLERYAAEGAAMGLDEIVAYARERGDAGTMSPMLEPREPVRPLAVMPIVIHEDDPPQAASAEADPGLLILTCANCGAAMDERKCKLICRCGYFLSCSDYY